MKVAILMGSASDKAVATAVADVLKQFGVTYDVRVLSAHRTPQETADFVKSGEHDVYIAIAGMAAHLAGAVAAVTTKPVIAVPVKSAALEGLDALLSSVMMPPGVPVACVAVNGGKNAGLLAVQILAVGDASLRTQLDEYKENMRKATLAASASIENL